MVNRPDPRILRGVGPVATHRYNRWGARGSDPPPRDEAYRILCVGGSTTGCTYLDDAKAWPQRLADKLNAAEPARRYWVGNIGIPGFITQQHLEFARESPLVDQVDCLVVQTGINDFMACLAGPRPAPPLWTHSKIRQLARTLLWQLPTGDTVVEGSTGEVYARRRAMRQAATIDDAGPDLADCLARFERELNELVDACGARDVRLVFTSQPTLWRADLDAENAGLLWFGELADGRYLSVERLRVGMDRYNDALRRVCARRGAELVDLADLNGDPAVFYDDCHFTELGAQRVGDAVARWFDSQLPRAGKTAP
jgi:lysophospholipase L1-like esterase